MPQGRKDPWFRMPSAAKNAVPPTIDDGLSNSDVIVREGSDHSLVCHARGSPPPAVKWRREDGRKISSNKTFSGKFFFFKSPCCSRFLNRFASRFIISIMIFSFLSVTLYYWFISLIFIDEFWQDLVQQNLFLNIFFLNHRVFPDFSIDSHLGSSFRSCFLFYFCNSSLIFTDEFWFFFGKISSNKTLSRKYFLNHRVFPGFLIDSLLGSSFRSWFPLFL